MTTPRPETNLPASSGNASSDSPYLTNPNTASSLKQQHNTPSHKKLTRVERGDVFSEKEGGTQLPIRVIIFDLGGVIAGGVHGEVIKDFAPSEKEREKAQKIAKEAWWKFKLGEIEEEEFWEYIATRVDIIKWIPDEEKDQDGSDSDVELLANLLRKYHITVFYEAVAFAIRCKKNGYAVGILSNHAREWVDVMFDRYRLYDIFDDKEIVVISCDDDVRAAKPDPKIYEVLMKKIKKSQGDDIQPQQVVFLDDKLPNVEAAADIGIRGVHFNMKKNSIRTLKKELKEMGCSFPE